MQHFRGIEGLRAWLAWAVVFSHVCVQGLRTGRFLPLDPLVMAGDQAVQLFIIISGFVITHLILSREEPYGPYIIRRFLRIYPIYIVCLVAGIGTTLAYLGMVQQQVWGAMSPPVDYFADDIAGVRDHFWLHVAAHVTLLHGLIPDQILPHANLLFLAPAWSLSLEWQFYLVAPFAIAWLRDPWRGPALIALAVVCVYLDTKGVFGSFSNHPSALPSAGMLFAIGILTRLGITQLRPINHYPLSLLLLAMGALLIFQRPLVFLGIWLMMILYLLLEKPDDRVSQISYAWLHRLLDSPIAGWLGQRSYATYLAHVPILQAVVWACGEARLSYWASFATAVTLVPVLTLIASALLYRHIEVPGIALGRRLAKRASPA